MTGSYYKNSLSHCEEASVFNGSVKLRRPSAGGFTWSVPSPWPRFDSSTRWSESRWTSLPCPIPGGVWWVRESRNPWPLNLYVKMLKHIRCISTNHSLSLSFGWAREWCIINDVACVNNQVSFLAVLNELHWLYRQVLSPRRTFERTQTGPRPDWRRQTHHYTNRTEATRRSDDRLCRLSVRFVDPP